MLRSWRTWLSLIVLVTVWLPVPRDRPSAAAMPPLDQTADYAAAAQDLLLQMSVEERVGQVFLATFQGSETDAQSQIADLILNYKIGGVVLLAENDNIPGPENTPQQVARLNNELQQIALLGRPLPDSAIGDDQVDDTLPPTATPVPAGSSIPLFIALNQEGDGYPYTTILNGLTDVPSSMAIGATWRPPFAQITGAVVGRELAAIGANLLLGPSLDVLEDPSPFSGSDLGVRTFGGDPYWVGLMGQAYTAGVHEGSNGRLAVVAKHFPGYGSSDRPLNEEVATVRKSLEQLKQIELAPFFAVTGSASASGATVDALLSSHIRYQGFQGNIRDTTAPVSFDPQALTSLMQLPEFTTWRQNGGLIISDALGVRAVQRFYDDREQEFPHRQIAKDAFLAGNDLLYLGNFAVADAASETQLANVKDTIVWFQEKYRTDQSFQQRLDTAVLRILQLKLRLYSDDFSLNNVLVDLNQLDGILDAGDAAIFDLAQAAVTLISPSPAELVERLPRPPALGDNITIFTNVRDAQQCATCPLQPLIGLDSLEQRILALYGPSASGQVQDNQIQSFSFADLTEFLAAGPGPIPLPTVPVSPTVTPDPLSSPTPGPAPTIPFTPTPPAANRVQTALDGTEWIIFAMLDVDPSQPYSDAVRMFLAQRPDIARSARVIVFAFNAPYYLDTTEISKLSAYYGVYSKVDTFIDAAVRALFQELPLEGAPPVDIPAISYDLFTVTQPNPNQIIDLYIAEDGQAELPPEGDPLELSAGDILRLQTGTIIDLNGNPVPDGTVVQFIRQNLVNGFVDVIAERPTTNGVAQIDYVLERRSGQFRISVTAAPARGSQVIDINTGENVTVIQITVTPAPTEFPTLSPTPTATATPSPTPTRIPPPATAVPPNDPIEPALQIPLASVRMLLGLVGGLAGIVGIWLAIGRHDQMSLSEKIRILFWGLVGSLLLYNYFVLGLPGAAVLLPLQGWAALLTTVVGGLAGLGAYWVRREA